MNVKHIDRKFDYAIIGSGAAGLHLAMAISADKYFDNKKILLIDKEEKHKNDRTWCYWEKGLGNWDDILTCTWDKIQVGFHGKEKLIPLKEYRYKMLRGIHFYKFCLDKISEAKNFTIVKDEVYKTDELHDKVIISCKHEDFEADRVFSSVLDYQPNAKGHPYLWQHFGGWFIKTDEPAFKNMPPQFMNFNIEQENRTQFMYMLPYSENEALFEFTLFSKDILKNESYEKFLDNHLRGINIKNFIIMEKEFGQIPMTTFPFWHKNTKRKMYIGSAGGWTKPSTGYTFYFCQKYAQEVTRFLHGENDLRRFKLYNRYFWFDRILLEVLNRYNHLGSAIFGRMFMHNKISTIFSFLNNESKIHEDIMIILKTKFPHLFFQALLTTLKPIPNES